MVQTLHASGGIEITAEPGELCRQLLADPPRARQLAERGRDVILLRQGATQRHVAMLRRLMGK
jgi:hypothetical protein